MSATGDQHLFISYASVDRSAVTPVLDALTGAGYRLWVDYEDIPGATAFGVEIAAAIRGCRALILMCSSASLVSINVRQELMLAWKYQRPCLPLILEPTEFPPELDYWLEGVQWIEVLDHPQEQWLGQVKRALDRIDRSPIPVARFAIAEELNPVRLPYPLTDILGRDADIESLTALLATHRLVTLTGPGGTGKTRLAIAVARAALSHFHGDVVFVDLAAITDPSHVGLELIEALHLQKIPGTAPIETLLSGLAGKQMLLVLDNFEQVVAAAGFVGELVQACPDVTVLITSRVPLQIPGEQIFLVSPLAVPIEDRSTGSLDLATNPAIQLFVERAREARSDFELTERNMPDIASICRRLDGLPLAIELAAALVRLLTPGAILDRLDTSLALLTSGRQGGPMRQRTLRDTIAWSYDLLDPDSQRAFCRLAVFRGGIAIDAAATVIWNNPAEDPLVALTRLDTLVQANLLQVTPDLAGEPRFMMLQTIQEFAIDVLQQSGEWEECSAAHAEFFVDLAKAADEHYRADDIGLWLDRLDHELGNFRVAVEQFAALPNPDQRGLEMAVALWGLLDQRGHEEEARVWTTRLFEKVPDADAHLRARALLLLGNSWFSNYEQAEAYYRDALAAALECGDTNLVHAIEGSRGLIALLQGEFERALTTIEAIVRLDRESNDSEALGHALVHLAHAYCQAALFEQSLTVLEEASCLLKDPTSAAWMALVRGRALRRLGSIDDATNQLQAALAHFRALNAPREEASCLFELGTTLVDSDLRAARTHVDRGNNLLTEYTDALALEAALESNALLLVAEGAYERAAELLGATRQWRESTGTALSPFDQRTHEALNEQIIATIGFDRYSAAETAGRQRSLKAAFEIERSSIANAAYLTQQ
ncbi:MAG TPA: TIR domain-containing protein [Thermomicrobiales bacterium]|nr:TIR domain-containing protein [Thermomicrobiales bacterium]